MIFDDVFEHKIPDFAKLLDYGFTLQEGEYFYKQKIVNNQFELRVYIFADGKIKPQVFDLDTGDEYRLHLMEGVTGEFVGKVRSEYLAILQSIADNCFRTKIYKTEYANKMIDYVHEKYHNNLEFLWEKFPECAVVRRADNKKWYAVFMIIEKNKIGLEGKEKIEVINLHGIPKEIQNLADGEKYFGGYHMNKKSWLTLCLDGRTDLQELYRRIDESYLLAKENKLKTN